MNVLITGVGGGGHGEQILKALRLADRHYHIIGTDMSRHSKGLLEVDEAFVIPPASDDDYVPVLQELCRRKDVRVLFHGSEPELRAISRSREAFAQDGVFVPVNRAEVIETCMDKARTFQALDSAGFRVLGFREVANEAELATVEELPAVLKPARGGGGSMNTLIAQTRDELLCFGRHFLSTGVDLMVQAYCGQPEEEYTVGVLTDMDGDFINSIAVRRNILTALSNKLRVPNRTGRRELGVQLAISNGISQGEIGRFPAVTSQCERIAQALGSCGPLNIQCRLVGGEVVVFEINPRFSGTTSLRAMAGFNEPDLLIRRHVLGERIEPRFPYRSGTVLRGLSERFLDEAAIRGIAVLDAATQMH